MFDKKMRIFLLTGGWGEGKSFILNKLSEVPNNDFQFSSDSGKNTHSMNLK